jgi:arylformamidase
MTDRQYRAELDAEVRFTNGGRLSAEGFRIDLPSETPTDDEVATLFLTSLGLLMVDQVELRQVRVFEELHKGTRGGPSDADAAGIGDPDTRWVELSHVISAGMITYPGLPGPKLAPHLTREASRQVYAAGTEFAIDRISMLGNTGTYLDSPFHRYAGGTDLAGLPLSSLADLPAVVVRTVGSRARGVGVDVLATLAVEGRAVLLHTGGDRHWGTPDYLRDAPYLTAAAARWLVDHGARLVGIDAVNIDDTGDGERPAHTVLLAAGIPIVEHLTGLDQLPPYGARFTAAPPRVAEFGTFPVRAYASVPT